MVRLVEGAAENEISISAIAVVEVRSAIRRRERAGEISPAHAVSAVASLGAESRRSLEHAVSKAVIARAAILIDKHALRALDALQLATAVLTNESLIAGEVVNCICSDLRLLSAAAAEGLTTWNPEIS